MWESIRKFMDTSLGNITVQTIFWALLMLLVGIVIVKIIMVIVKRALAKTTLDESLQGLIRIIVRVLLLVIVVLIVADYIGIPITSLVAVLSVAGLAVSLAIQDTLANVFGGILLLAAKTFASGDYVQIGSLEGSILKVDLMNTYLLTADNKHVRIPNKDVQTAAIVNYTREPTRRVEVSVNVSYDAPTEAVKTALLRAATNVETVLADPAPFAGLMAYENSSVRYVVRGWTHTDNYWDTYFAMIEGVREVFAEDGIAMTFDHINVHMIEK